jgi:phage gp45-like
MHRATPLNIALRAFTSGGARGVVTKIDDSKFMQEMTGNFMHNESRGKVEAPQNYGFTSVNMPPDFDALGKIIGAAEHFSSFIGGARSFPIAAAIDDRRHRLFNLAAGDVAMFRTAIDQLQFHLAQEGGFWTGPNSKKLRMALVQPDQQQQQQGSGSPKDASGGGGSSGQAGGAGGQQQKKGQQAQYKKDSNQYHEINGTMTQSVNKQHQIILTDKKTGVEVNPDNNVYLGKTKGNGTFLRVVLEDGSIAQNVYGLKSSSAGKADEPSPLMRQIEELRARVVALEKLVRPSR